MNKGYKDEWTMGTVDLPLNCREEDRFGYESYIRAFSNLVSLCETPMTISIQGDWGVGKTSFVHMVMSELKDEDSLQTVEFNTWKYSKFNMDDRLSILFLEELVEKVVFDEDKRLEAKKIILKALTSSLHLFNSVQKEFTHVDLGKGIDGIGSCFAEKEINLIKELDRLKQILEDSAEHKKIVVFIDDLDRLAPTKAFDLLEILQIFLTIKNFVFILAVDYEVVVQGFTEKMGESYPKMKSKNFFDKIIQLSFSIPKLDIAGVDTYIKDLMKRSIVSEKIRNGSDYSIGMNVLDELSIGFKGIILNSVQFNPRKLKRVMNNFWLLQMVIENRDLASHAASELDDANVLFLLFYVLCMQLEYEPVYHYFLKNVSHIDRLEKFINYMVDSESFVEENVENELTKDAKNIIEQMRMEDENSVDRLEKFSKILKDKLEEIDENDEGDVANNEESLRSSKNRYLESVLKLSQTTSHDTVENKRSVTRNEALMKFQEDAKRNGVMLKNAKNKERYIDFCIQGKKMKIDFKSSKNYLEDDGKYSGWHSISDMELASLDENSWVLFCLIYSPERAEYLLISKEELVVLLKNKKKDSNNKYHFYFKDDGNGELYEKRGRINGIKKFRLNWENLKGEKRII